VGSSLGAKLYLDGYPLDADPLAPESPLMVEVMTRPMVGSSFPGTSRFAVCAKSPLTGIWKESACGGNFGPELKKAGYDGIVIIGRAEKPVVLSIVEGKANLTDASALWGKDVYETTDLLKAAALSLSDGAIVNNARPVMDAEEVLALYRAAGDHHPDGLRSGDGLERPPDRQGAPLVF